MLPYQQELFKHATSSIMQHNDCHCLPKDATTYFNIIRLLCEEPDLNKQDYKWSIWRDFPTATSHPIVDPSVLRSSKKCSPQDSDFSPSNHPHAMVRHSPGAHRHGNQRGQVQRDNSCLCYHQPERQGWCGWCCLWWDVLSSRGGNHLNHHEGPPPSH